MAGSRSYLLAPDSTPDDDPAIIAFFVLLIIGGNVLIPIMVIASFVQKNHYCLSPIFMNFCFGWVAYSVTFLLSFYSGRWKGDLEPIAWLCELQAILVYVLPVWVAATTNALIFELWMGVTGHPSSNSKARGLHARLPLRTCILLIFPYFCAIFMGVAAGLVSHARPDLVGFRAIFCSVDFQPLRTTISVFCLLAIALGFALQFDIGLRLYGARRFGKAPTQDWRDTSLFIRMLIFLVILAVGVLAAGLAGTTNSFRYPRQIIQGLFPLSAWLVFGTNPAIYKPDPLPKK